MLYLVSEHEIALINVPLPARVPFARFFYFCSCFRKNKSLKFLFMEGKGSLLHQAVQKHIYDLLPQGEAFIEYRLPGHVADLLWLPKKIAFEIQVSPISIDTAVARTDDYKKMGLFIVWILHQKSFNSTYLTLAELFLRKHPTCYYTNISTTSYGYIYDQTELLRNNKREERGNPSLLDLKKPLIKRGGLSFKGDRNQNFLTKSLQPCYTQIQKFFSAIKD